MGQSAAGIAADNTKGKFGPFAGQMFVGDQALSTVMRCYLRRLSESTRGVLSFSRRSFVRRGRLGICRFGRTLLRRHGARLGFTRRQRLLHRTLRMDGKTPFEIKEMRAKSDGFELVFTKQSPKQRRAIPRTSRSKLTRISTRRRTVALKLIKRMSKSGGKGR